MTAIVVDYHPATPLLVSIDANRPTHVCGHTVRAEQSLVLAHVEGGSAHKIRLKDAVAKIMDEA